MELTLLSLLLSSAVEPVLTSLENNKSYRLSLCRPQVFTKIFCALIVSGLALALASCGGGGSGDDKNHSPVAKAGADVSVTLPYAQTSVKVQLDGSESYDIDGDSLTYSWTGSKDPDDVEQPELQLTAGNYLFHLAVTDSQGVSSALDSVEVSVIDASTLKALEADPSSLTFSALQQSTQLKVTATYNNDSVWDVTTLASGTQYLPENPGIISIDKDGLARAIGIGQTSIRIQNGALSLYVMAKVDTPPVAPVAASKTAIETLESQISDSLVVSWNPNSGLPASVMSRQGYLSASSNEPALDIVTSFLQQQQAIYQFEDSNLADMELTSQYTSANNGIQHLVLKQSYQGLPVMGGQLQANLTADGRVINIVGHYYPQIDVDIVPDVPALTALNSAIQALQPNLDVSPSVIGAAVGIEQATSFDGGPFPDSFQASLVILPVGDSYHLCWKVRVAQSLIDVHDSFIDAHSGEVVSVINLVDSQLPDTAGGLVFANSPDEGVQEWRSFMGDLTVPSAWLAIPGDPKPFSSWGNNAFAGAEHNLTNPDEIWARRPQYMSEAIDADFSYIFQDSFRISGGQNVDTDKDAAIANVFYWVNQMHDHYFHLGFDAAAGNFQLMNCFTGDPACVSNDPVVAYVQYGWNSPNPRFRNNAFFLSSPDGKPGVMAIMVKNLNDYYRDLAFSSEVLIHEYTHGVTNRLVGGPQTDPASTLKSVQGGAMGEGWSDFFAASYLNDTVSGDYTNGNLTTGIRRYALDQNPLTYADLGEAPGGPEVHNDGEIWSATLWDLRVAFTGLYGADEGQTKVEQLIIDAITISPGEPSMLDMRDYILRMDVETNNAENQMSIWQVFANRGMGFSASANGPDDADPVEAFDLPSLELSARVTSITVGALSLLDGEPPIRLSDSAAMITTAGPDNEFRSVDDSVMLLSDLGGSNTVTPITVGYLQGMAPVALSATSAVIASGGFNGLFIGDARVFAMNELGSLNRLRETLVEDLNQDKSALTVLDEGTGLFIRSTSVEPLALLQGVDGESLTVTTQAISADLSGYDVSRPLALSETTAVSITAGGDGVRGSEDDGLVMFFDLGASNQSSQIVLGSLGESVNWALYHPVRLSANSILLASGGDDQYVGTTDDEVWLIRDLGGANEKRVLSVPFLMEYKGIGRPVALSHNRAIVPTLGPDGVHKTADDSVVVLSDLDLASPRAQTVTVGYLSHVGMSQPVAVDARSAVIASLGEDGFSSLDDTLVLLSDLDGDAPSLMPITVGLFSDSENGQPVLMSPTRAALMARGPDFSFLSADDELVIIDDLGRGNQVLRVNVPYSFTTSSFSSYKFSHPVALSDRRIIQATIGQDGEAGTADDNVVLIELSARPPLAGGCFDFEQSAPQLDVDIAFNADQRYLAFEYLPGPDHSTDVSFDLRLNGAHINRLVDIAAGERRGKIDLPNNVVINGRNTISLLNPSCAEGVGSCIDGSISSWGGTLCFSARDSYEVLWYEKQAPELDIEAGYNDDQSMATMSFSAGPRWCTTTQFELYLNNNFFQNVSLAPGESSDDFLLNTQQGGNMISLRNPVCSMGDGCCSDVAVSSWGGTLVIQ